MNPINQWLKSALDADLTPSQQTTWLALLLQTAGFGKVEDDLSDSRLEKLTKLRRDRAKTAVSGLVDAGLIAVVGKGKYGTIYRIPEAFLGEQGNIGLPSLKPPVAENVTVADTVTNTESPSEPVQHTHDAYLALEARYQQLLDAHQALVDANKQLVESNQKLVDTNQNLVSAYQNLVSTLPKSGGAFTEIREGVTRNLVTNNNILLQTITTTDLPPHTPPEQTQAEQGSVGKDVCVANGSEEKLNQAALQYPEALNADERVQAAAKLDGLHPSTAQEVLDALAWNIANGKVKKSTIGLLVWLADTARKGTFDRTPALEWRKQRVADSQRHSAVLATELNHLANEIKALQSIYRAAGVENPMLLKKIDSMKADYFSKLESYKVMQAGAG